MSCTDSKSQQVDERRSGIASAIHSFPSVSSERDAWKISISRLPERMQMIGLTKTSSLFLVRIRVWKRSVKFSLLFITMALCSGSPCRSSSQRVRSIFGRISSSSVSLDSSDVLPDGFRTIGRTVRWSSARGRTIVPRSTYVSIGTSNDSIWIPTSNRTNGQSSATVPREIPKNMVREKLC